MSVGQFQTTFNVGTDQSITILDATGQTLVVLDGKRSMFEMTAADLLLKGEVIDNGGVPDHRVLADGWTGRIEVQRQSDGFGQLYAFLEQNYYNGAVQGFYTIVETIRSPFTGGATVRYQYVNCVFHGYKPGSWQKKTITKATVEVACAQRVTL